MTAQTTESETDPKAKSTRTNGLSRTDEIPSEDRREDGWIELLSRVGVPKRHRGAYWESCRRYAGDEQKRVSLQKALSFAGKDGSTAGRVHATRSGTDVVCFSLLLMGDHGTGKTFLATATFKHLLWHTTGKSAIWSKFYEFIREVQSTYSAAATTTVRKVLGKYQNTPILLLDDVGDLTIEEQTEDRRRLLYEVLDKRNDKMLPTILTSNLSPTRFEDQFGERTLERVIEMAAMYRMEGRNYRQNPTDENPITDQ